MLAPGQEWSNVWDTAMARLDRQDLPERHDVRIDFSDARGRPVTATSRLSTGTRSAAMC